ncbi:hypothetical protein BaRGS_00012481 [Batillaria attramentaria]|uniref:Uncharacterized protein n=1 Tax=Batillaria attramentaria TaxID=370345 RepID=A0ABD0L9T0_9CAEN
MLPLECRTLVTQLVLAVTRFRETSFDSKVQIPTSNSSAKSPNGNKRMRLRNGAAAENELYLGPSIRSQGLGLAPVTNDNWTSAQSYRSEQP